MTRTVFGEARGEPFQGKLAVSHVILNRVKSKHRRETTVCGVCTEPYQFSAWNEQDPNRAVIWAATMDDENYLESQIAVLMAIKHQDSDPTKGATFYHTKSMNPFPNWSDGHTPCYETGGHLFYNTVK